MLKILSHKSISLRLYMYIFRVRINNVATTRINNIKFSYMLHMFLDNINLLLFHAYAEIGLGY